MKQDRQARAICARLARLRPVAGVMTIKKRSENSVPSWLRSNMLEHGKRDRSKPAVPKSSELALSLDLSSLTDGIARESAATRAFEDCNSPIHQGFDPVNFACVAFAKFFKQVPGALLPGCSLKWLIHRGY